MFNSIKCVKILEEGGFSRQQAEANLEVMSELTESNLATKQDLRELEIATRQDIKNLEAKMELALSQQTIRLGAIVSIALGILVALNKLL